MFSFSQGYRQIVQGKVQNKNRIPSINCAFQAGLILACANSTKQKAFRKVSTFGITLVLWESPVDVEGITRGEHDMVQMVHESRNI